MSEKVIKELNGKELDGRVVHVRLDRIHSDVSKDLVQIFIGNVPWICHNEDLIEIFKDFNPVACNILTNMYGKSRGFAIMKFKSENNATEAIATMNNFEIHGRNIEVSLV